MLISTKTVTGRRTVRYQSYDDFLQDAERLAATSNLNTLGNWAPGQIFHHLAKSLDGSIDGTGFKLPWPLRVVFSLLMKKKYLYGALPAGFKAPGNMQPEPIDTKQAFEILRAAIERQKSESRRAMHPAFGNITRDEWDQFNLRHCEMHMSFISETAP